MFRYIAAVSTPPQTEVEKSGSIWLFDTIVKLVTEGNYGLFMDTVIISEYLVPNGRITSQ